MLLEECESAFFGGAAPLFKKIKKVLTRPTAAALTNTEFMHVCCMLNCVSAGCASRWHYYSPLNQADTVFFVKCLLVALVVRSGAHPPTPSMWHPLFSSSKHGHDCGGSSADRRSVALQAVRTARTSTCPTRR